MHGQHRRRAAERERTQHSVAQRFLLLMLGQAQHANRQDHGIVGAQHTLETDEQCNGEDDLSAECRTRRLSV